VTTIEGLAAARRDPLVDGWSAEEVRQCG